MSPAARDVLTHRGGGAGWVAGNEGPHEPLVSAARIGRRSTAGAEPNGVQCMRVLNGSAQRFTASAFRDATVKLIMQLGVQGAISLLGQGVHSCAELLKLQALT